MLCSNARSYNVRRHGRFQRESLTTRHAPLTQASETPSAPHQPQVRPIPRRRHALPWRIRTGRVPARGDPALAPLADVPVLTVGHVPEPNRIRRIEPEVALI